MKPTALRLAVLASGRGSNLGALVQAQRAAPGLPEIALVASDVAGCPALAFAAGAGLPTAALDPRSFASRDDFDLALAAELRRARIDLVCLAGYRRLLGRPFVEAFPGRILNIHPSLLPAFPGLHAQRQALRAGVRISGCTVHFVDLGLDTGPIVAQAAVPVLPDDSEASLSARILTQEHQLYPAALRWVAEGRVRCDGGVLSWSDAPSASGTLRCPSPEPPRA